MDIQNINWGEILKELVPYTKTLGVDKDKTYFIIKKINALLLEKAASNNIPPNNES